MSEITNHSPLFEIFVEYLEAICLEIPGRKFDCYYTVICD